MKLKSYIRGIGIGIIVTSAVFLVSGMNDKNKAMTDAEVIARAKELGYVESTTLAEMSNVVGDEQDETSAVAATPITEPESATPATELEVVTPTPEPEENQDEVMESEEPLDETVEAVEDDKEPVVTPKAEEAEVTEDKSAGQKVDATKDNKEDAKEEKKPETTVTDGDSEDVVIVVNPGDGSDRVAKKLFDAGLVPNAYEFDQFLMANGYDRKITTGNHIISRMATGDEIGKNLVSPTK